MIDSHCDTNEIDMLQRPTKRVGPRVIDMAPVSTWRTTAFSDDECRTHSVTYCGELSTIYYWRSCFLL